MCTEEEKGKKSVYWLTVPVVVEFRGKKSGKKSTYHCQTKYFSTLEGIKRLQRCKTSQNDHSIYAGRLRRSFGNVNNFKISPPSAEIFAYENSLTALWTKTGTLMNYMTFSLLPIHVHFQLLNDRGQSSSVRMQDSSHETRHDKDFLFYFRIKRFTSKGRNFFPVSDRKPPICHSYKSLHIFTQKNVLPGILISQCQSSSRSTFYCIWDLLQYVVQSRQIFIGRVRNRGNVSG